MRKNIIFILTLIMAAAIVVLHTDIKSVDEYYLENAENITEESNTVFISVRCDNILENLEKLDKELYDIIPKDGIIIEKTEYVLRDGDSVFDILMRAAKLNRITIDYTGRENVYVKGIDNIYEFSCGERSGWTYLVNGETPLTACSSYELKSADVIEWVFTCDFSLDVYE